MHYIKNIMALVLAAAMLHGCAVVGYQATDTDLPDHLQAHLKAHPGDIRFNRPIIKWTVADDPGPDWHVLPDKVYVQLYKDKFNQVWNDAKLDQGTGKAYDVVVEVPIIYEFPGLEVPYWVREWSYRTRIIDPDTGEVIGAWGLPGKAPTGRGGYDAAPCGQLGHRTTVPAVVAAVVTPLVGVKSGDFAGFEEAADALMAHSFGNAGVNLRLYDKSIPSLMAHYPDAYRNLFLKVDGGHWDGYELIAMTMAETQAAAEKAGYQIDFPDTCHDFDYGSLAR